MEKLSPPRFHAEISCNFDITCKSGRPNFALFSLEYGENHRFLAIIRRKNYLLLEKFIKFIHLFLSCQLLAHTNTNSKFDQFFRFQPKTRNILFLGPTRNFRKKSALTFL
jgi:hypothetical protein